MNPILGQEKGDSRTVQGRPIGRVILINLNESASFLENITTSLTEYFMLCNNMFGSARIDLFGLYLLHDHVECLIPLQRFKINLHTIIKTIQSLQSDKRKLQSSKEDFQETFSASLSEACSQLQQIMHNSTKTTDTVSQLDFCLFTTQQQRHIEKPVADSIRFVDSTLIKKVQIVHVNSNDYGVADMKSSDESHSSIDSATTEIICEFVEALYLENSSISFIQHFKSWLKSNGSDDVHLFLDFNQSNEDGFQIKCDVIDTLINPVLFNGGNQLLVETEINFQQKSATSVPTSKSRSLPVYSFKSKSLVRLDGICESVLYGLPYIVKPTSCWRLDWEELEKNQNMFMSICSHLQNEQMAVLVEGITRQSINPYYLLLPSSGATMLLKSIATRDLMMPYESEIVNSNKISTINEDVETQLKKLEVVDSYNPYNYTCGVFNRKVSHLPDTKKKSNTIQNTVKKNSVKKYNHYHSGFIENESCTLKTPAQNYTPQLLPASTKRTASRYVPTFQRNKQPSQSNVATNKRKKSLFKYQPDFPNEL